ncbi:MAG: hypothetical protein HYW34_00715 [Candidatus Brennerbacteria bacterium]|nr:hypothetical protein [Candidatus Brennerbacteria bacterium]
MSGRFAIKPLGNPWFSDALDKLGLPSDTGKLRFPDIDTLSKIMNRRKGGS